MDITIVQSTNATIMKLDGELDASNYLDVVSAAKELHTNGTQNLLLDLSQVSFMASSGLVAIHSIAMIMSNRDMLDPGLDWNRMRAITDEAGQAKALNPHCKLYNPAANVLRSLQMTGFTEWLAVFTDIDDALASFY